MPSVLRRCALLIAPLALLAGCQELDQPLSSTSSRSLALAACVAPPDNLIGWWPADGTPNDIVGSRHGSLVGEVSYVAGQVGQAFSLPGNGDYVDLPDESAFDFTTALTVDAWIKVDAFSHPYAPIVAKGDNSWRLQREANTNFLAFGTSGLSNVDLAGDVDVNDGQWHHVAAVFDGSTKYLYVDGQLDASAATTGTIQLSDFPVRIGHNAQESSRFWDGQIDEVEIFDRALSAQEIAAIHAAGPDGKCKPGVPSCLGRPITTTGTINGNGQIELTAGDDVWRGTAEDETVLALGGNDRMCGLGGDDSLFGGQDDDILTGNGGADYVTGEEGDDTLYGDAGNDVVLGQQGDDMINGGSGADRLFGGKNRDKLLGGSGVDELHGEADDDELRGQAGRDHHRGGTGTDLCRDSGSNTFTSCELR